MHFSNEPVLRVLFSIPLDNLKHQLLPYLLAGAAWSGTLTLHSQVPTKCLEIERVLVDACNSACSGAQEGENEMFRFIVGPLPIALADLEASWATPNTFLGWVQNATSASVTAQLNATITNCGWLVEPPGGILPAGRRVLGITSTNLCIAGNSFAGLNDTLFVIYQAPGNTFGHFKNHNNGSGITAAPTGPTSYRTFQLSMVSEQCTDSVTYNLSLMVNQYGTYGGSYTDNDGSSLEVSWPGAPTVTYVNDGCQAPITPFWVQITTEPEELPCGGTTGLTGIASGNIATVFWTGGTGNFTSPNAYSTNYTLGASETNGTTLSFCAVNACGDTTCTTIDLQVEANTPLTITADGPTTICEGTSVVLTANGGNAYAWNTGATTTSISVDTAGTYSVESTNACGTVSADVTVGITAATVASITGPTEACAGAPLELIASGVGSYFWNTSATTDTVSVEGPGTYFVVVSGACGVDTASITIAEAVTVIPGFSAPIRTGCEPFCIQLTATSDPTFTYTWNFNDGGTASGPVAEHCFAVGIHDVTLTAIPVEGDPRCPGTVTMPEYIEAWATPIADFSSSPAVVTLDAPTVQFTDHSTHASQLQWQLGTPEPFTSDASSFTYTFSDVDCYSIVLIASNANDCVDESEQVVCVEDAFLLWAPNSFTPNNDGINDGFQVITSVRNPEDFQLTIYDRWGRTLATLTDKATAWTGEQVPDGVYTWTVSVRDSHGKIQQRQGHVTLLR